MIKVAILGVGTVGQSVVRILQENKELIRSRCGKEIRPVIGVVKDLKKPRQIDLPLSDNLEEVLNREDIDIFIELLGGVDLPYKIAQKVLLRGKDFVTANKAMLAYHRYEIQTKCDKSHIGFEASVAGGIPIIKTMREGLSANQINSILAILNGTSNFILTSMTNEGKSFHEALNLAQKFGYAESDPSLDISGEDAAHKLLILASIAYGIHAKPEDILIEGIENITQEDIAFAKECDFHIKLLCIAKQLTDHVELRVHPALISNHRMISKVDGVMNAISIVGNALGESMYYGAGAGGDATASAVISDLMDIARGGVNSPMLGYKCPSKANLLLPKDLIKTQYFIRICVLDQPGVLAKIAQILTEHKISIQRVIQKPKHNKDEASLLISTHTSCEIDVQKALKQIDKLNFVKGLSNLIRIEK